MSVSIGEYIQHLQDVEGVQGSIIKYTVAPSAVELLSSIKNRIFKQGLNSNGSQIGSYSTTPIYVKRNQFAKPSAFAPGGKTRNKAKLVNKKGTVFVVDKKRKTMYLEYGYKQLRDIQGLQTGSVDLKYRGRTAKAYVMQERTEDVLLGLNTVLAAAIRSKQEDRFKAPIFSATQTEIQQYISATNNRLERITRGILVDGLKPSAIIETPTDGLVDYGVV